MLNAFVLAIAGFLAALGAIELTAETGNLALSLAITLAIYALVLSCFARLADGTRRSAHRAKLR